MNKYKVTWGEKEEIVYAPNETDAWAKFAEGCDLATRSPKLFRRVIELLEDGSPKEANEDAKASSPVADSSADEAIDHIRRMRSAEKLQQIADADERVTVAQAAKDRLTEISNG